MSQTPQDLSETGANLSYDIIDMLKQLVVGYDSIVVKCEENDEWGSKQDWIEWFTGNKNSKVGRKLVEMMIQSDVIVANGSGLYHIEDSTPKFREKYVNALLNYFKLKVMLEDISWLKVSFSEY